MDETKLLYIDIVRAMPTNSDWRIQYPHRDFFLAIAGIPHTQEDASTRITLKEVYRIQVENLADKDLYESIQSLYVFFNGKKILEAFDGFVITTVSKEFDIQSTNLNKYLDRDILFISDNW